MDILIGICLVVITVALIILVVAVTKTVKQAETFIAETKRTVNELRTEVIQMSSEAREVVQNTNAVTVDARRKLKDLDGLFNTVSDIGEAAHALTTAAKQAAVGVLEKTAAKAEQTPRAGVANTARASQESAGAGPNGAQIRKTAAAIAEMVASSVKIWSRMKAN